MNHAIEGLWNGKINPCRSCGENDPEMKNLVRLMEINLHELADELSEAQANSLSKYLDNSDDFLYFACLHAFSDGFSLAVKLLGEAVF